MKKTVLLLIILLIMIGVSSAIPGENLKVTRKMYIVPYIGDIDGNVASERYKIYGMLADFYIENNIPVGVSFYPQTVNMDQEFMDAFLKMYHAKNIDLIHKGDRVSGGMAFLSIEEQERILRHDQEDFYQKLRARLGFDEIILPKIYNNQGGSFNIDALLVLQRIGINDYFDVFLPDGAPQVQSRNNFRVFQYGISMPRDSTKPGENTVFKSPEEIVGEINTYARSDISIMYVNGAPVIPLWLHQQDFFTSENTDVINNEKWEQYKAIMLLLKNDPNVVLIKPSDVGPQDNEQVNKSAAVYPLAKKIVTKREDPAVCGELNFWYLFIDTSKMCGFLEKYIAALKPQQSTALVYDFDRVMTDGSVKINRTLCINKVVLKNRMTKEEQQVTYKINQANEMVASVPQGFSFNQVQVNVCNDGTEVPSAGVSLEGGRVPTLQRKENVFVCEWKGCRRGAVSVTVDDYFNACVQNLDKYEYKGTYYLSNTNAYTQAQWDDFNAMFKNGHELGTHTQSHWCIEQGKKKFGEDMQANMQDILAHTDVKKEDLVSHSYPCGFSNYEMEETVEEWGLLSGRGYNINQLEESDPENFFKLKSINSIGYPGGELDPPDFFKVVEQAQREKKWAILTFHSHCEDNSVIDYLPQKNVWMDTVGNVVRYTKLRENAQIEQYNFRNNTISFQVTTDAALQQPKFNESLSLKVGVGAYDVRAVNVNGQKKKYDWYKDLSGEYIIFDVPFPINATVRVIVQ